MHVTINTARLELGEGDITRQQIDAIVNAANSALGGGGGVDGAIHRAGGHTIKDECSRIKGGCPTGEARITGAGNLQARYVIHAVGPFYNPTSKKSAEQLAGAYRASMQLAAGHNVRSIAFPSISTGAYRYPLGQAAPIALKTVADALRELPGFELVRFVLYDRRTYDAYAAALRGLAETDNLALTTD